MYNFISKFSTIITVTSVLCILLIFLCVKLSWKYLRIFYYLHKIPGPKGWSFIGNALLLKDVCSSAESYFKFFDDNGTFFKAWMGPIPVVAVTDPNILREIFKNPNSLNRGRAFQMLFKSIFKDSIAISKAAAMGIDINDLQTTKGSYAQAVDIVIKTAVKRFQTVWIYPQFTFNLSRLAKKQKENLDILWDMTNKVLDAKLKSINKNQTIEDEYKNVAQPIEKNPLKKPFLEFLLDMVQVYPEFTIEQLKEEINFLIMAAYETTPTVLSYVFLLLAAKKHIQQKVYNEIFDIFGNSERPVELDDLPKLKYLEMVIKETLRLYPAVGHTARIADEDLQIGDYFIPAGTSIIISILVLHRSPEHWENPMEFDPERFLTNPRPNAYMPFSSGPRNCIGEKYAMMLLKILTVNILRKYEIDTPLNMDKLKFRLDLSLKLVNGYLITIKDR